MGRKSRMVGRSIGDSRYSHGDIHTDTDADDYQYPDGNPDTYDYEHPNQDADIDGDSDIHQDTDGNGYPNQDIYDYAESYQDYHADTYGSGNCGNTPESETLLRWANLAVICAVEVRCQRSNPATPWQPGRLAYAD